MANRWSTNEIDFLKNNYSVNCSDYCVKKLGKTTKSIYMKAFKLGLILEEKWVKNDDIFLIENYSKIGIHGCVKVLNRSIKSIKARTNKLKIKLITNDELINKFIIKHYNFYIYKLVNYINSKTKINIICPIHGNFEQLPYEHLRGKGCPNCRESKGEKEIRNILESKKINFSPQYKFNDCKNINKLPFDFYLPDYNTCIEFHGEQHYKPIKWFGGETVFNKLKSRDKIKENYCNDNNIKLIIIPYRKNILKYLNHVI